MTILNKIRTLATYLLILVFMLYTFSVYEPPIAKEDTDNMPAVAEIIQ